MINNPLPMYFAPRFFVEDDIVYGINSRGIVIMNNSDPTKLELIGKTNEELHSRTFLTKYNNLIFMIRNEHYFEDGHEYYSSLEIYDVEDLSEPKLLGELFLDYATRYEDHKTFTSPHSCGVVEIDNDIYYLWQAGEYLVAFDCSSLTNPIKVENFWFTSEMGQYYQVMKRFYIKNNLFIVPTRNESSTFGFGIFNMTSLQNFNKVSQWFGDVNISRVNELFVKQERLYLKEYPGGEVFDISNITAPTRIGYINISSYYYPTIIDNSFFVSALDDTIEIYNYTDIHNITKICSYSMPIEDYGNFYFEGMDESKIAGNRIYLPRANTIYENTTLLILKWNEPNSLELLSLMGFPDFYSSKKFSITIKHHIANGLILTVIIYQIIMLRKKKKSQ